MYLLILRLGDHQGVIPFMSLVSEGYLMRSECLRKQMMYADVLLK